jgi:hypothetical protein
VENKSGMSGRPLLSYDRRTRWEIGAGSCTSVRIGPALPWELGSALNQELLKKFSA